MITELENLEILVDTIEPGGPVHDAAYNIISSMKKAIRHNRTVSPDAAHALSKALTAIAQFAQLEETEQWGVEERLGHMLMNLCKTFTS